MKAKKILYFTLMYLPVGINLIALFFLPAQIPTHYGYHNQADRWGSKYEILLIALITVFLGYFTLAMAKSARKREKYGKNNENITLLAGLFVLILFNAINVFMLYAAWNKTEDLSSLPLDLNKIIFGILGVFMVVFGNIMPKLRKNSLIGLRTPWSMKSDAAWKKCQRVGGISLIAGGIVTIGICIAVKGTACLMANLAVWGILTAVDVFLTYRIASQLQP